MVEKSLLRADVTLWSEGVTGKTAGVIHMPYSEDCSDKRQDRLTVPEFNRIRERLLAWYEQHGRDFPWRHAKRPYEKVIAELLLQRTQATTVAGFYHRFLERYPSWESLAGATEADLQCFLRPVGLWRRRARSLLQLAKTVSSDRGLPTTRDELEKLPGIGQYVAGTILALCQDQAAPFLDVNMARVLERVFGPRHRVDIRYDQYLQNLARLIVQGERFLEVNWAILDFAALVCLRKHPKCVSCPVGQHCRLQRGAKAGSPCPSRAAGN